MIRPKKHLGQHFLRDENIAQKIVGYLNPAIPLVLEVGPGMGVLTKYILGCDGAVHPAGAFDAWFMEVDRESVEYLGKVFPQITNRLLLADFLSYDLGNFPPDTQTGAPESPGHEMPATKFTVIGNFPYNISSQILFKALEFRNRIPEVIGMFQKEVAERIAAPPGNKTYGIISVLLQAFYDIDYLFTVSETVFYPPPKVKSAVIRLRRNTTMKLDCDEQLFIRVVKMAFNQRRKTLRNAIRPMLPATASGIASLSEWFTRNLDLRAEQLSVDDFVRLTAEISTFAQINISG
ncbi:MAG: 16S rRNA (adenine(1518)-N(6)/adenine(1519)-N(6))-dimethyltransferase RsmA [Bacteroidota bacterium]